MSFYHNYSRLIRIIRQNIKIDGETVALDDLLRHENILARSIELKDIASILHELFYINWLIARNRLHSDEIDRLIQELTQSLVTEIKTLIAEKQIAITAEPLQDWLSINFYTAQDLIKGLGLNTWLDEELSLYDSNYDPAPRADEIPLSLLQIVLSRNMRLGYIPAKEWYYKIDALKHLSSRDAVLQLAYTNIDEFQNIHYKYPGFLAYTVTSFDDLSTFCQLLNDDAISLLTAPQVKPYLKKAVDYARIINRLNLSGADQVKMLSQFITSLDDLILVINSYPKYAHLLGVECEQVDGHFTPYKENDCAQLIKTSKDLARFNLSNIPLQKFIYHIPRLRGLACMSDDFLADVESSIQVRRAHHAFPKLGAQPAATKKTPVDPRLLTLGAAINYMQTCEGGGYYTSGNIQFDTDSSQEGHFHTYASQGQMLAIALSHRAFQMWQQLANKTPFEIMECGGGEGDLCFKILEFIHLMGIQDSQWLAFAKAIHYTILELSPALILRQKERLKTYVGTGVVEIIQDNALQMVHYPKVADLHISNELMDVFAPEQIVIDEGIPKIVMAIPVLIPEAYQYLSKHYPDSVAGVNEEAADFQLLLSSYAIRIDHEGFAITAERFKRLMSITANASFAGPAHCFLFTTSNLPVSLYPEIEQFLVDNEEILFGMQEGDTKIISPVLDTYAKLLTQKAKVSIVVDYGGCSFDLNNAEFRSYGSDSDLYKHLALRNPGKRDVTYDVSASELVNSLHRYNAQGRANFFKMGDLLPQDFVVPPAYEKYCSAEHLDQFKHNYFFAVDYIAPETKVRFADLEQADRGFATHWQYFFQAKANARLIVNNKTEHKPAAAI